MRITYNRRLLVALFKMFKILLVHSDTNMCYMRSYINIYTNMNNRMSK